MTGQPQPRREPAAGPAASLPATGTTPPITIRCREDGPLVFELPAEGPCPVRVIDHVGRPFPIPVHKRTVALCRCGHSKGRPWCDGSHRGCGFVAADLAPVEASQTPTPQRGHGI